MSEFITGIDYSSCEILQDIDLQQHISLASILLTHHFSKINIGETDEITDRAVRGRRNLVAERFGSLGAI
jgi:hypothetical protein